MPNPTATQVIPSAPDTSKSSTNWSAFGKAGLAIDSIRCEAYYWQGLPLAPVANSVSCHTTLPIKDIVNVLTPHINEHVGRFEMKLKQTEGKTWPGWDALANAGIEILDIRCSWCRGEIERLHPQHLLKHLKNHPGSNRRTGHTDMYYVTLGFSKLGSSEDEDDA